jgi:hypothetical protein
MKVITAVLLLKIHVLWGVTPCRLVGHRRFEESWCPHIQGLPVHEEWTGLLDPEYAIRYFEIWEPITEEHTVTSQKTRILGNYVTC